MTLTFSDLKAIRGIVKEEISSETSPIRKDVTILKKNVNRIEKKLDYSIDALDREYLSLKKRVDLYHPSS
jgi:hypothetical protein